MKSQWNKPELDSRYLVFNCNNRKGDLLSLLPSCKENIVVCLINQRHVVFYLGKALYLVFYTGMILNNLECRHLEWPCVEMCRCLSVENYCEEISFQINSRCWYINFGWYDDRINFFRVHIFNS